MPASFSRSMRSLDADRVHTSIARLFVIAALLGAWQSWFFLAQVELYELSNSAHFRLIIPLIPQLRSVASRQQF